MKTVLIIALLVALVVAVLIVMPSTRVTQITRRRTDEKDHDA